jgi:hypothetical protein
MLKSQFADIAEDVFAELLPKVKKDGRRNFVNLFFVELQNAGLDVEDDFLDDEEAEEISAD